MFLLKKIQIIDQEVVLLDVEMLQKDKATNYQSVFTTLILGENGVGKSFLLKTIADIFIYLNNAQTYKRKPKYSYDQFYIEYYLDDSLYSVHRVSGSVINCFENGEPIEMKNLRLPSKTLAVAFMVNDKFRFAKRDDYDHYAYLGVRKSTNATYTSSVLQNVIDGIVRVLNLGYIEELNSILKMLKFEQKIELCNYAGDVIFKIDSSCDKAYCYNSITSVDKIKSLAFYKNNTRLVFEDCSSGEKHIVFAFMSILSAIEKNSLILIDEPEISLHPEWQIQYISLLKHVFKSFPGCHIILASHSHYFVSDLEGQSSSIVVLKRASTNNFAEAELLVEDTYAWSAENIIYNVFGLRTTRNYYFESDLQKLICMIQESNISELDNVALLVDKLKKYVFDDTDPLNIVLKQAEENIKCLQEG